MTAAANTTAPTYNNAKQVIFGYLYTSLFCIAIAIMLWLIGVAGDFVESLAVSFAIGLSVNTAFVLLEPILLRQLSAWLAPAITSVVGLAVGLALGGYVVSGRPGFFFLEHQGSLVLGIFFGITGYLIFGSRARVMELDAQLAHTQAAQANAAQKVTETELRLLQAQIEPHFLFNTLSNITSLIRSDPTAAEQMLENLSTLLRHSLGRTRSSQTTLGDELSMLKAYLAIQKIRMGSRLEFTLDVSPELNSLPMPPMLLQPLVENSVLHGIEPAERGGSICVSATVSDGLLRLTVKDTGIGISATPSAGQGQVDTASANHTGTGLQNVKERLRALYPAHQGKTQLEVTETQPHGVTVSLRIPIQESACPAP